MASLEAMGNCGVAGQERRGLRVDMSGSGNLVKNSARSGAGGERREELRRSRDDAPGAGPGLPSSHRSWRGVRLEGPGVLGECEGQWPCKKNKKAPQTPLHPHPKGRRERESAFPLEGRDAWRVWGKAARRPRAESAAPSLARGEGGDPHRRTSEPGTTDIPLMPAMSPELGPRLLPASCHSPGPHPGLYRGSRARPSHSEPRPCHAPSSPHRPHGAPPLRVPISPLHSEPRPCRPQAPPRHSEPRPRHARPRPSPPIAPPPLAELYHPAYWSSFLGLPCNPVCAAIPSPRF